MGSNDEMLFNVRFMKDVHLLGEPDFNFLFGEYTIVGKQLFNLIKKLEPVSGN